MNAFSSRAIAHGDRIEFDFGDGVHITATYGQVALAREAWRQHARPTVALQGCQVTIDNLAEMLVKLDDAVRVAERAGCDACHLTGGRGCQMHRVTA